MKKAARNKKQGPLVIHVARGPQLIKMSFYAAKQMLFLGPVITVRKKALRCFSWLFGASHGFLLGALPLKPRHLLEKVDENFKFCSDSPLRFTDSLPSSSGTHRQGKEWERPHR